jgi:pilus assembly protein Flp/PilA
MRALLFRFAQDERGVTAIEYGLIGGPIAVVVIAAVTAVGSDLSTAFNYVGDSLNNAISP